MTNRLAAFDQDTIILTIPVDAESFPQTLIIQFVRSDTISTLPADALGIDISHWQSQNKPVINWQTVKDVARVGYVFIKATEGLFEIDDFLLSHRDGARSVSLPYGFYHYARISSGAAQADFFLAALGADTGLLPLVIDYEEGAPSLFELRRMVDRLRERVPGKEIMIYTRASKWAEMGGGNSNSPDFSDCSLWVSHPNAATPILPVGWQEYAFWQMNWQSRIPGITGDVDINKFKGTQGKPWWVRDMNQVPGSPLPVRYQVRPKVSGAPVTLYESPRGQVARTLNITWTSDVFEITLDGWLRVGMNPALWGKEESFKL